MPKTLVPEVPQSIYRAAAYARLSVDDTNMGTSYSISNQIDLITDFANAREDFELVDIYADDGVSGSIYDRPEWNRLLGDISRGHINCILVKDLSRMGRNYLETSRLLDRVLPTLGVRVVAINDDYDSLRAK